MKNMITAMGRNFFTSFPWMGQNNFRSVLKAKGVGGADFCVEAVVVDDGVDICE